jgi:hypothetical protein
LPFHQIASGKPTKRKNDAMYFFTTIHKITQEQFCYLRASAIFGYNSSGILEMIYRWIENQNHHKIAETKTVNKRELRLLITFLVFGFSKVAIDAGKKH